MKYLKSYALIAFLGMGLAACNNPGEKNNDSMEDETMEGEAMKDEAKGSEDGMMASYELDSAESKIMWEGNMLKVGGISLYGHKGTLDFTKGILNMKDGKITDGTLVVDMSSMQPTDDNFNPDEGKTKDKLVGHLSSDDFFSVDEFPTATFKVTGVKEGIIMGDMTIRGVTNQETVENVKMEMMDGKMHAKGDLTIDRQKYNVAWDAGKDKVLSDDLDLQFNIVANKSGKM